MRISILSISSLNLAYAMHCNEIDFNKVLLLFHSIVGKLLYLKDAFGFWSSATEIEPQPFNIPNVDYRSIACWKSSIIILC